MVEVMSAKQKSLEKIKKAGLPVPKEPKVDEERFKQLPADLTACSENELGKYLTVFTGYNGYVDFCVSCAELDSVEANDVYEKIYAQVLLEQEEGKVNIMKSKTTLDKRVVMALEKKREKEAIFRMTESIRNGYINGAKAISREITRRSGLGEWEKRVENLR